MAHLRLTTEPGLTAGCARVGAVSDDSIKDLRRKIVKAGGNAAVLSFEIEDMSTIHAEFTGVQPPRTLRHESAAADGVATGTAAATIATGTTAAPPPPAR